MASAGQCMVSLTNKSVAMMPIGIFHAFHKMCLVKCQVIIKNGTARERSHGVKISIVYTSTADVNASVQKQETTKDVHIHSGQFSIAAHDMPIMDSSKRAVPQSRTTRRPPWGASRSLLAATGLSK